MAATAVPAEPVTELPAELGAAVGAGVGDGDVGDAGAAAVGDVAAGCCVAGADWLATLGTIREDAITTDASRNEIVSAVVSLDVLMDMSFSTK